MRADQPPGPPPSITVEGRASVDVKPDTARLSLGVSLDRSTAATAAADVARALQAVADALRAERIRDADVTTGSVTLSPVPAEDAPGRPRRLGGFRASVGLVVTVRPAEKAGPLVSRLVEQGANAVDGVDYLSSREDALRDDLRGRAVLDARRKAEAYVAPLGLRLGRVLEITPDGAEVRRAGLSLRAVPAPAPVPDLPSRPGLLTIDTAVSVRWEIAQ